MYIEKTITYHQLTQSELIEKLKEANDNGNVAKDIEVESVIEYSDVCQRHNEYLYGLTVEIKEEKDDTNK